MHRQDPSSPLARSLVNSISARLRRKTYATREIVPLTRSVRLRARTASSRCNCVTFDLWETLLMDDPKKDLLRRKMRCEGLRHTLSRSGVELSLTDLLRGYDESVGFLLTFWRRNRDVPTAEQIGYILDVASNGTVSLRQVRRVIEELQEAYTNPVLSVPPTLNDDALSTLEDI